MCARLSPVRVVALYGASPASQSRRLWVAVDPFEPNVQSGSVGRPPNWTLHPRATSKPAPLAFSISISNSIVDLRHCSASTSMPAEVVPITLIQCKPSFNLNKTLSRRDDHDSSPNWSSYPALALFRISVSALLLSLTFCSSHKLSHNRALSKWRSAIDLQALDACLYSRVPVTNSTVVPYCSFRARTLARTGWRSMALISFVESWEAKL